MAQTNMERPGSGTATGRVWEIADELTRRNGTRAQRASVIEAYVSEGGNPNTANTQFQRWRRAYEENRRRMSKPALPVPLQVKEGGRLVLPAEVRSALGVGEGDTLIAEVVDAQLRLMTRATARRRAQEIVRQFVPPGVSLVDELIAERRREARRESEE